MKVYGPVGANGCVIVRIADGQKPTVELLLMTLAYRLNCREKCVELCVAQTIIGV